MAFQAHMDDSGSEPQSSTFVLAGYVLPAQWWPQFSDAWNAALRNWRNLKYLKMSDVWSNKSDSIMYRWSVEDKDQKLLALANVIADFHLMGLVAHLNWKDYKASVERNGESAHKDNPYRLLFYAVIDLMAAAGIRHGNLTPVDFIFDEHGKIGHEAISWYRSFRENAAAELRWIYGAAPIFRDEQRVVALQAADMLAWYERRKIDKPLTRPVQLQISELISRHVVGTLELECSKIEQMMDRIGIAKKGKLGKF